MDFLEDLFDNDRNKRRYQGYGDRHGDNSHYGREHGHDKGHDSHYDNDRRGYPPPSQAWAPQAPAAMNCQRCGCATGLGHRFCPQCGGPLSSTRRCHGCGRDLVGQERFCPGCGTPSG